MGPPTRARRSPEGPPHPHTHSGRCGRRSAAASRRSRPASALAPWDRKPTGRLRSSRRPGPRLTPWRARAAAAAAAAEHPSHRIGHAHTPPSARVGPAHLAFYRSAAAEPRPFKRCVKGSAGSDWAARRRSVDFHEWGCGRCQPRTRICK